MKQWLCCRILTLGETLYVLNLTAAPGVRAPSKLCFTGGFR